MAARLAGTNGDWMKGSKASVFLDDKHCLVIDLVALSSLEQIIVFPHSEFKQGIADVFR